MSAPAAGPVRELVRASAGSGKTFRISSRIIGLLASGEEASSIFASTFTRKAAGEILERVLARLSRAALDPEEARELASHVRLPAERAGRAEDPAFWRSVLARTVRSLHELDVGTLDAFFGRAVRAFGHDLGLPSGWTIADEPTADRLRSRALEAVLADADRAAVLELVRGLGGGQVGRSVHDAFLDEVDALARAERDRADGAPGWSAAAELVGDGSGEELAEVAAGLAVRLEAIPLPTTNAGSPAKRWQTEVHQICAALRAGDWDGVAGSTLVQRAFADEPRYGRHAIEGDHLLVLREAAALVRAGLATRLLRRAEAMGRLGASYGRAFDRVMREVGALRFEDVTRLLTGEDPLGARADLFYRLDGATRHVLLDEFQDTSLMQWAALRPLIDALLGPEAPADATVSIVADPKQSIYGWRGAAPVVVEAVERRYPLSDERLSTSYRSSQWVLDAVNGTFEAIAGNAVVAEREVDRAVAEEWGASFERHEAYFDLPGHVTLEVGPPKVGRTDLQPDLIRFAARRVRELHRRMPERSIGVLTRSNRAVGRFIFELRALGVPASEEGGTRLVDSPAVVSVLALLRMADHPGDTLARYHVAGTPVGPAVGLDDHRADAPAERVAHDLRRSLLRDGYGPTLAGLRDELLPACDPRDELRLGQLVELGFRYDDARPGLRVDDFVRLAEAQRVESAGEDPVRVMTVHGSKGLEFDVVVLPELHPTMFGRGGDSAPLALRPEETGPATHLFPPMKKELRELFEPDCPPLARAWAQQRAATVRDALSVLYVGMTRARYALHMVIPADGKKVGTGASAARLLRHALAGGDEERAEEGKPLYEEGDPEWSRTAPASGAPPARPPTGTGEERRIELRRAPRRRLLPRRKPSDHARIHEESGDGPVEEAREPEGRMDLRALLGLVDAGTEAVDPRIRGTVVHAWMEEVGWIEDGLPDADTRGRILGREAPELAGDRRRDFLREWGGIVETAAEREEVRTALSRARAGEVHPGAELVVERELPFLLREEDALVEGIIDRLVLVRRGGRVVAAEVMDYKTDRIAPGDDEGLGESVAVYAPQLRAYRRAVAHLYGIEPDAVRLRLVYLVPGVVRDVDGA